MSSKDEVYFMSYSATEGMKSSKMANRMTTILDFSKKVQTFPMIFPLQKMIQTCQFR